MAKMISYLERANLTSNPTAKRLFQIMDKKQTNLAIAADVTTTKELLYIAEETGPEICILKTHIDILSDFDSSVPERLLQLSEKHQFLIFEDRKFADIGNSVKAQYQNGIYHIASWAHITNAHILPGPGLIKALEEVGKPLGRGLLLLAEMSSKDNLLTPSYTKIAIAFAKKYSEFVIGFIAQHRIIQDPKFIIMTPGVNLKKQGDRLGQQYQTPESVIAEKNCDIIIVGRGITEANKPRETAKEYRKAGWNAYLSNFLY